MKTSDAATAVSRRTHPIWLGAGLALGLLLATGTAVAATAGVVSLVGPNGVAAQVTRAGQLEVAPAAPATSRAFYDLDLGGAVCTPIYTAPAGESLVLQEVTVDIYADTSPGSGDNVQVTTDAACQDPLFDDNPSSVGATVFPLGSGVVVPAGHRLYAIANDNILAEVYGYGYLVPVRDAPNPTVAAAGSGAVTARHAQQRR